MPKEKKCEHEEKKCKHDMKVNFRFQEAYLLASQQSSRDIVAFDNIMYAQPNDAFFDVNFNYVVDQQLDPNNMDINIDGNQINNVAEFRAAWIGLTTKYKYRKRYLSDIIPVSYCQDPTTCLRTISYWAVGSNFGIFNAIDPRPFLQTDTVITFDRFYVVKVETVPGIFKIKTLVQQTESVFPLQPSKAYVGSIINGPTDPRSPPDSTVPDVAIYTIPNQVPIGCNTLLS